MPAQPASKPLPRQDLQEILDGAAPSWERLRGQRLFVTGGTGFFGLWLLESFLHANRELDLQAEAVLLSRSPEAFLSRVPHLRGDAAWSMLRGDIRDFPFPPGEFQFLIHAATETAASPAADRPGELLSALIQGTDRVLGFAAQAGVRRLLLTSSGAVYGRHPPDLDHVPKDWTGGPNPLRAASVYAEGKRVSELLCALAARFACSQSASSKSASLQAASLQPASLQPASLQPTSLQPTSLQPTLEVSIARAFAFLGPHLPLNGHFAAGNFLRDALAGGPIRVGGDGSPLRSYLYPTDLAIALWTMLTHAPSGRAYNVGSEHAVTIRELAETVASRFAALTGEAPLGVEIARPPVAGALAERYVPSTQRLQRELGLHQRVMLPEAIHRTLRWLQLK